MRRNTIKTDNLIYLNHRFSGLKMVLKLKRAKNMTSYLKEQYAFLSSTNVY
jgi:hypothetical protein